MFNLWNYFPATWTYVSPVIAMILGGIILHEHFGVNGVIGAILVLVGVIMANSFMIGKLFFKENKTLSR